jgi:hypothetical protein
MKIVSRDNHRDPHPDCANRLAGSASTKKLAGAGQVYARYDGTGLLLPEPLEWVECAPRSRASTACEFALDHAALVQGADVIKGAMVEGTAAVLKSFFGNVAYGIDGAKTRFFDRRPRLQAEDASAVAISSGANT